MPQTFASLGLSAALACTACAGSSRDVVSTAPPRAADHAPRIHAMAVHAKDDTAKAFYQHFDFVESPTDPFHLFVLIKDLKHVVTL